MDLHDLKAAINAIKLYWHETHTYPKSCPKYVVGYGSDGIQIMKGRCTYGGIRDLRSIISGWQPLDLGMTLAGTHDPVHLSSVLYVRQREVRLLQAFIYAWHAGNLPATLNIVHPFDLPTFLRAVPPVSLSAYLKVHPQSIISASTYGWQASDLGAYINQIWQEYLPARVTGRDDMFKNLQGRISGYGSTYSDLNSFIRVLHWRLLGGTIRATYLGNLPTYLYAIPPRDLITRIHAWDVRNLQGIINGQDYPWNMTAEIYPMGRWSGLYANINPSKATEVYSSLQTRIHPWEMRSLPAYILGANALFLGAYLNPLGYSGDLHAAIRPKMIRLTTVISISTLSHKDLSAMINSPCFRTGYSYLPAFLYAKYKSDLYAYIRPLQYNNKPSLMPAKTGYADSYLEVDKLKLSITIYPAEFFAEDKYKLVLSLFGAENALTAYVRGTLRYGSMSAYIVGEKIEPYTFDSLLKNREKVIHKTYDGVFQTFETVEMAFKSAVKDYYYSSDGNYAWKEDRFQRWVLDVKSMLPADTALRLKRRLHRATTLYNLKRFTTIDEALRFAIAYVTEYPKSNLGASIYNRGTYTYLGGIINPRYIVSSKTILSSTINPVGTTIVLNEKTSISKI